MMNGLVIHTAILGRATLPPGVQKVKIGEPEYECLVAHSYNENIVDEKRNIKINVSDCTIFSVTHIGLDEIDINDKDTQTQLLDRSLSAISEVIIWAKTKDVVGKLSSYARQVGRLDVKVFVVDGKNGCRAAWKNPLYDMELKVAAVFAKLLSRMIVQNGPAMHPTSQIVRRIMSSLDLLNLGFYTESFITASLCDDLAQNVVKAGMLKKGLDLSQQKEMLRAIKEERLKLFLTNLLKLCDWKSLAEDNPELFKSLMKTNSLRNLIMHGDKRISRSETLSSLNTILATIAWLRLNPFGYVIDKFPLLLLPEPQFIVFDDEEESTNDSSTT